MVGRSIGRLAGWFVRCRCFALAVAVDGRLKALESRMDVSDIRIAKLEQAVVDAGGAGAGTDASIHSQIKELEKQLDGIRLGTTQATPTERECTAVVGGLASVAVLDSRNKLCEVRPCAAVHWLVGLGTFHLGPEKFIEMPSSLLNVLFSGTITRGFRFKSSMSVSELVSCL